MPPLKVTAVMDSAIAGDIPMLDSLLILVMSRHHRCRHSGSIPHDKLDEIPIPLERTPCDGLPIPRCSVPIFVEPPVDQHEHIHTAFSIARADLMRERDARRVIRTGSGTERSYRIPLRIRAIDRVVWFCRGSRAGVRATVRQINFLGKKVSYGHGRVASWIVEEVDDDLSWFAPSDDGPVLMRPLPMSNGLTDGLIGYQQWYGSPCPPYWQRDLYREIVRPC